MTTSALCGGLALLSALGLAACGRSTQGTGEPGRPGSGSTAPAMVVRGCSAGDPSLGRARELARADLDGDGTPERVWLTGKGPGPCARVLFTRLDGVRRGVTVGAMSLDPTTTSVVALEGTDRELLRVDAGDEGRGGYRPHLFGAGNGSLGEVLAGGDPVFALVPTDEPGAAPTTATCTPDGGLATLRATPHRPSGVVLAWDVHRTAYTLRGDTAVRGETTLVEDGTADPLLRKRRPQLFDPHAWLAGCSRPAG